MVFDFSQNSYQTLRGIVAERTRPILAWVGSGFSAEAGLPTWKQLKEELVDELYKKSFRDSSPQAAGLAKADSIRDDQDYWRAFQRIESELGRPTFRDIVRQAQGAAVDKSPPAPYSRLWEMPTSGIITLNLDRMPTRTYADSHDVMSLSEFNVDQISRLPQVMHGRRFVLNLHGIAEDSSSWYFTHNRLQELARKPAYMDFLRICLVSFTNLFLGMSADDIAANPHLQALTGFGLQTPSHFWITSKVDVKGEAWADAVGARIIQYHAPDKAHGELIDVLSDLVGARPVEPPPPPPVQFTGELERGKPLPRPEAMMSMSAEEIRAILNAEVTRILVPEDDAAYKAYDDFVAEYDEVIFRAWYTSDRPGRNMLLGYKLNKQIARGAFGRVYRADSPDGREVAVKVLLDEVRQDSRLLQSFRRGVRSMRILQAERVDGMVAYEFASEIPAFVTMEWIEGPNLSEAKEAHILADWDVVLDVSARLIGIIRAAHALPSRVLHRDIRPANVMLKDYWVSNGEVSVVVLDFDLSWHRGAQEKSVVHTSAVGYQAPEQLNEKNDGSTRSAAVDAFGLGMTIFYLCGGVDPIPEQHKHADWENVVLAATAAIQSSAVWKSLPRRVARLILNSTRDRQSERWDLGQMQEELSRLRAAHLDGAGKASLSMLVEEIAARASILTGYSWDEATDAAEVSRPTGVYVKILADTPAGSINLEVGWRSMGTEQRVGMSKYIEKANRTVIDRLKSAGWTVSEGGREGQALHIAARLAQATAVARIDEIASRLDACLEGVKFSE